MKRTLSLVFLSLTLSACGPARKLPDETFGPYTVDPIRYNDVEIFDYTDTVNFSALPLNGDSRDGQRYWSGDYWPFEKGSINKRWNAYTHLGRTRLAPTAEIAKLLNYEELAELSPIEKYDLLIGRYDYPLTQEVQSKSSPEAKYWEGICHGWATASIYHVEPKPKDMMNPQGVLIPFGSADIKALISYYYAFHNQTGAITHHIGKRCDHNRRIFGEAPEECKSDVNAGSFHLALANTIGLKRASFLMDLKRFKEVWNQPVVAFDSEITKVDLTPGDNVTPGTVKTLRVKTVVTYVEESERNSWYVTNNTSEQIFSNEKYEYLLYLNSKDEVIGGKWKSDQRPDFIWRITRIGGYSGLWESLAGLMND